MADTADESLSKRASEGCRASLEALLERHYDRVYRLAWRWCGSRDMAEDIAQDVAVKLARAISSYRGESKFSSWLYRIAYTTTLDHMRANQRITPVEPSEIISLLDARPQDQETGALDGKELWDAVRALPNQQRDAVLLVYGEDMSHADAAKIMECSEKTVSWHLFEAKKKLRILLEAVG